MVIWPHPGLKSKNIDVVHGKRGLTAAPTSLVDIGSSDGVDIPRIVPGGRCLHHENPGYIVLSYYNGLKPEYPQWHLTTHTQATFEECLPLHLLPQTLRDAIDWTRRLGDRFVWIDNLSIIQDSMEDWNRESFQMASIHGNATVTLVAAAGSIYGGMTDIRNPLRNSACRLSFKEVSTATATQVYLLPCGQKSSSPKAIPTESRGWCYQEYVLSPRLVKFTLSGIEWQCRGDRAESAERARRGRIQGLESLTKYKPRQWYLLWYALIERYSNKQLTYPEDKLTAFSGIAAAKVKQGTYVAGVCKEDVCVGLLWARNVALSLKNPGYRYSKFVAPSWSWASFDAAVIFHQAKNRILPNFFTELTLWDPTIITSK